MMPSTPWACAPGESPRAQPNEKKTAAKRKDKIRFFIDKKAVARQLSVVDRRIRWVMRVATSRQEWWNLWWRLPLLPSIIDHQSKISEQLVPIIAATRLVTGLTNQPFDLSRIETEGGAGTADDVFLHHDGAEIVRAIFQSDLADLRPLGDPRALDVGNIVEKYAGQCLHAQVFSGTGRMIDFQDRVLRLKRPADERGKPAARVLLVAQPLQVLDAILDRFDVAKHHRRARLQAELVRHLHHLEPLIALAFERRDSLPDGIDQNLAAAARDRTKPRFLKT